MNFSTTVGVYSVILYIVLAGMNSWTLLRWIGFAALVDVFLLTYFLVFLVMLRCCSLLLDEISQQKARKFCPNDIGYVEIKSAGSPTDG
ncbi:hypothetical protein AB6A40_005708 [Gnathostoma spinigerum]|uniref:Uncharacterized protein n=1 Tax=Gnathostoma spinigerum TaxID=75299 RepID=A0ABD6ELG9_9BILA